MATKDDLQAAFAGESQANRKYLAFAKKAEAEGLPQIAKLFRAAAAAETVHAHAHLRVMGGIKSTKENLQAAMDGEGYEYQKMYPDFLKDAEKEGNRPAALSFKNALAVEEIHHGLYSKAKAAADQGKDLPDQPVFVCEVCGNTVFGAPPGTCPVCNAPKEKFTEVK